MGMRRAHAHTRTHEGGSRATASPRRGNSAQPPPGISQLGKWSMKLVHKCPAKCKKVAKSLEVWRENAIFAPILNQ